MKRTTLIARIICMALMVCMLASAFAACTKEEEKDPVKTDGAGAQATGVPTDEYGYELDALGQMNINEIMDILNAQEQIAQCAVEELSEDVVGNAIYNRWKTVEDRLNVEIVWHPMPGQWSNTKIDNYCKEVEAQSNANNAYDACVAHNLFPGALANRGLLLNLGDGKYLDFTAPWWPKSFVSEVLINNVVYGAVESSSKGTLRNLHGVFFNNALIEDYKLDDPYKMVENNTWTFANMMAMIKDTYSDKDQTAGKSAEDFFGLVTGTKAKIETWFFCMGYRYSTVGDDGMPELLMDDNAYMTDWVDAFNAAAETNDFLMWDTKGHTAAFFADRAILYMTSLQLVESGVNKQIEMDYGVVPCPKKDSSQENYVSNVANTHDAWMVPISVRSLDDSSALLECMASEAYRQVAPVYFDQCIKLRYAPDERLGAMYDLIRDTAIFDFCQIYSCAFTKDPRAFITDATDGGQDWTTVWDNNSNGITTGFQTVLDFYGAQ